MTIDEKLELVASLIFVSKKYNEAIDLLNKALPDASTDEDYQGIYQGLSAAFEMIGNTSQAIACAKLAADYGNIGMVNYLENVFNINYTPQKPSSSSAPNSGGSSATARPAAQPAPPPRQTAPTPPPPFSGTRRMNYSDGAVYDGEWLNGLFHGKGKYILSCGDVYEGDWANGKFHGKGTYTYADGTKKEGDWKDGKYVLR